MVVFRKILTVLRNFMQINFDKNIWNDRATPALLNVSSPFAPVDKIHIWLRQQGGGMPSAVSGKLSGASSAHEFYCLYICLEGSGHIEIDGVPHYVGTDEVLGVLPRHPHRRLPANGYVKYLLIRFICKDPEFIQSLFNGTFSLDDSFRPGIQELVEAYEKVYLSGTEQNHNAVGLKLGLLLNQMTTCEHNPLFPSVQGKRIHDALKMIIDPENLNVPFREIARKMGITPGHLSDLVHDNLGYPPRSLKHALRHQLAVNYLLHSSMNITQIAEAAGFKSVYAFSRFFKNVSGVSPMTFRKQNKKNNPLD